MTVTTAKRKPFQRVMRFAEAGAAAAPIELFEQHVAKKLQAVDAELDQIKAQGGDVPVVLSGDVTGPGLDNTVTAIQGRPVSPAAPAKYAVLGSQDGTSWTPRAEGMPSAPDVTLTFPLAAGSADATVFTVPATPTGAGRFTLQRVEVRLSTALGASDTGTVAVRVGTTLGGNDIGTDQTITNATAQGVIFSGLSIATRGSAMLVANGYELSMAAGAQIFMRATTTGTITKGACTAYVYGAWHP